MLTDDDFEKEQQNWQMKIDPSTIGFVSGGGSIFMRCGMWSLKNLNNNYEYYDPLEIDTITHEFGHVLQNNTIPVWYKRGITTDPEKLLQEEEGWQALTAWGIGYDDGEIGHHTNYSNKNDREGFAESYMSYVSTGGVTTDPNIAKTYAAISRVIDAARRRYGK
jgi:hypothetical protein